MDLVVDIGNTRVHLATIKDRCILSHWAWAHSRDDFFTALDQQFQSPLTVLPKRALIVSVNPPWTIQLEEWIQKRFLIQSFVMDRDLSPKVINSTKNPEEVGRDRLMNSLWATHTHPGKDVIVVSLGTAVTYDVTTRDGQFLGGAIGAGLHTGAKALKNQTSLLPQVSIQQRPGALGQNTEGALSSGLFWGLVGAVDRVCEELKATLTEPVIIATGGDAPLIAPHCKEIQAIVPNVTMLGAWWALQDIL
jgi:type III pantothenate kinase